MSTTFERSEDVPSDLNVTNTSPTHTLRGPSPTSTDEKKTGDDAFERTVEADEVSITQPQHVYDDEKLRDYYQPSDEYEGRHRWDPAASWTKKEEASVVRKIDLRIMTFACLIFFCLNLDRSNITIALSDNLLTDLGMTTNEYNNGQMVFYISFLSAELPSQIASKRFGPDRWIPLQVMVWSLVTLCQAFNTGRTSFYITRALLGLAEGGLIPDMILWLSYYYTTVELPIRLSWFWATMTVTNIVGSLLGAGLLQLRGVRGWEGWRYLFLVEGCLTLSIGFFAVFYMPASPTQTASKFRGRDGWFSEKEEVVMVNRVLRDDPSKASMHNRQPLSLKDFKDCLTDYDNWPLYLMGFSIYQPFNPPAAYLTLTLRSLGFSTFHTNLLTIPSSVLWIILVFALTFFSRRVNERTLVSMIPQIWGLVFLTAIVTLPADANAWVRYALLTLLIGHPYTHPILVAWNSTNANSVRLRTVSASLYNMSVQCGSIFSSQIYRENDKASNYKTGNKALLGLVAYNIILTLGVKYYFIRRNRSKKAAWKALTSDEKLHYSRDIAPTAGNKSLLFELKH